MQILKNQLQFCLWAVEHWDILAASWIHNFDRRKDLISDPISSIRCHKTDTEWWWWQCCLRCFNISRSLSTLITRTRISSTGSRPGETLQVSISVHATSVSSEQEQQSEISQSSSVNLQQDSSSLTRQASYSWSCCWCQTCLRKDNYPSPIRSQNVS